MSRKKVVVGRYVRETLLPQEALHAVGEMHWGILVGPVMVGLVVSGLWLQGVPMAREAGNFVFLWLAGFAVPWVPTMQAVVAMLTTECAVTSLRVLRKTGWIRRDADEISMTKIETVKVRQGVIGRLLGFGTVEVLGTGGHGIAMAGIAAPMKLRETIQQVSAAQRGQ